MKPLQQLQQCAGLVGGLDSAAEVLVRGLEAGGDTLAYIQVS